MSEDNAPQMLLLFTDQAEYYCVCANCYYEAKHMQWSGSTRVRGDWRGKAMKELKAHTDAGKGCEWCDPVIGGGGWSGTSATHRRNENRFKAGWKMYRRCLCGKHMHECTPAERVASYDTNIPAECPHCHEIMQHVYQAWVAPQTGFDNEPE